MCRYFTEKCLCLFHMVKRIFIVQRVPIGNRVHVFRKCIVHRRIEPCLRSIRFIEIAALLIRVHSSTEQIRAPLFNRMKRFTACELRIPAESVARNTAQLYIFICLCTVQFSVPNTELSVGTDTLPTFLCPCVKATADKDRCQNTCEHNDTGLP